MRHHYKPVCSTGGQSNRPTVIGPYSGTEGTEPGGLIAGRTATARVEGGGTMRRPSWRSWRVVATVAVLATVSTACLGGGNNGSNAPGQSITPKTAVEPTSPVTITFSSW